ncbi:hypothetical protein BT63DRAFT_467891 [Microthyrium microscopicum]|uniref:Uncharacterized protein n=1 Tax=Microthyrium microscopicum TaxID=703497 RepID=A0A6A6UHM0_9PEZI|nr:hypothetical protein BT63DRAFT_467891 [Microthyrium microscopicum]
MPPIRRYLRVTRYTVLEVRIHLDDPGQIAWLLRGSDPALRRIIDSIRPLVLPKLREENERAKGKSAAKKRGVKDTVIQDDFEVSVFLTDSSTRHQLLTKSKTFSTAKRGNLKGWLEATGSTRKTAEGTADDAIEIRAESPDNDISLADIPMAGNDAEADAGNEPVLASGGGDDDKKLIPRTFYDGFSIYGRVLCLVIKRRGLATSTVSKASSSQQMMESWVSTQAAQGGTVDDGDAG